MIIEERFSARELEKIVRSMEKELAVNDAKIVSGDTKVVPKGSVDKLFINTTGVGEIEKAGISAHALQEGMAILVSRDIGAHVQDEVQGVCEMLGFGAVSLANEGVPSEACSTNLLKTLFYLTNIIV